MGADFPGGHALDVSGKMIRSTPPGVVSPCDTITGPNVPTRSRGMSTWTGSASVTAGLARVPLRECRNGTSRVVRLMSQMFGQFLLQRCFQHPLGQPGQQHIRPDQLRALVRARATRPRAICSSCAPVSITADTVSCVPDNPPRHLPGDRSGQISYTRFRDSPSGFSSHEVFQRKARGIAAAVRKYY